MRAFQVKRKGTYPSRAPKRAKVSRRTSYRSRRRRVPNVRSGMKSGIDLYQPVTNVYRYRKRRVSKRGRRFTRAVSAIDRQSWPKHYITADPNFTGMCGKSILTSGTKQGMFPGIAGNGTNSFYFSLNTVQDMTSIFNNLFGLNTTVNPLAAQNNQERVYVQSSRITVSFSPVNGPCLQYPTASYFYLATQGIYIELYHCRARYATSQVSSDMQDGFLQLLDPNSFTGSGNLTSTVTENLYGADLFKNKLFTSHWKILSKKKVYLQPLESNLAYNSGGDVVGASYTGSGQGCYSFTFTGKPYYLSYADIWNGVMIPHKSEIVVGIYYGEPSNYDSIALATPAVGYEKFGPGQTAPASFVYSTKKEYTISSPIPVLAANRGDSGGTTLPLGYTSSLIAMHP